MKRILFMMSVFVMVFSFNGCQPVTETPDPNQIHLIELSFNPDNLELTSLDEHLNIEIIDQGLYLDIVITPTGSFLLNPNLEIKVNQTTINRAEYTIIDNTLTYQMPHPNPVDPNSYVPVEVELNPNGGYWSQSVIDLMIPDMILDITAYNDLSGLTFSLFDRTITTLRWYYKLFIVFDSDLDAYRVVYADPATASISNLVLPDYDYVIGVHLHTEDEVAKEVIISLTENFKQPMVIRFDSDLSSYESGILHTHLYPSQQLLSPVKIIYNEALDLPVPTRETYHFLGWSDGVNTLKTFPRYQAKDGIQSITYVALWQGATLMQLKSYLNTMIPVESEEHLVLPTNYGGFDIVWESSHPDIIDQNGHYRKPYQSTLVTLSALVTSETENDVLTFEIETYGYKSLSKPIASSYIYRGYSSISDAFFEILDVINTAFILAEPDGTLTGNVYLNNVSTYIMPKARQYGNWVIMSVAPESAWSTIAASSVLMERFADNIVSMINMYGFDGVDIDWETPTPSEATRYTALMRIVHQKVKANNPNHLVTTAITGGMWQPPRYDLQNSSQYIDYINMMTYGMVTSGAQYQNALYPSSTYHHATFKAGKTLISCSISESVAIFRDQYNIPLSKIIVGVAFYGIRQTRTFNTLTQQWSAWAFAGSVYYTDIDLHYADHPQYSRNYDQTAGVPYIIKTDGTEFISYDNYKSIRDKGIYIISQQLGGMMFWENGTDSTGTLLEGVRAGLNKS